MKNKLTLKLIVLIIASITLIAAIMAPIYFYLQPKMYIKQEIGYVNKFTEDLKSVEPFTNNALDRFVSNSPYSYRIYVFDENYVPFYSSYDFGNNQKFLANLFGNKMDKFSENSQAYYSDTNNEPAVRIYTTIEVNGETYYIHVKDSLSGVSLVFDFSNKILSYVVIGYIIVCSVILYLAISPSVKSARKVTKVAKSISENNLSVRYEGAIRNDEIGELALSINKMADTIQENINNLENYNFILREDNLYMKEYEETRRMLLCNITHDLKTPLAVISSQVEMIAACDEQEKKDYYYRSAMEEISKMSKMLSDVLQMTIAEHNIVTKKADNIDVSEFITELCKSYDAYIKSQNLKLKTDIAKNLKLTTIKEYIEFVFRNYLSNAVQNAEKNTEITVALREIGSVLRLSVENIGKNIPDDMKDKIWTNAFTTSPEGKNNTGLGLFIVKEISLIEHTDCGFENLKNGVRFWFDFISYEDKE